MRYICICVLLQKLPDKKVRLSGYGVELAIKSTEYKAKDDTKVKGMNYRLPLFLDLFTHEEQFLHIYY